jgi:transcriptional regulator with XRE-family HTH domain
MSSDQVERPRKKAKDPETEQLQAVLRVRLKQLIERFPGRQTELAEKAGLKQSNISETFNHMPTLAKAVKICRAGGVTLDWLVGGADDNSLELRQKRPVVKVVDKLSTSDKIRLQPSAINVSLLEYILKVVRGLDFWNELNPEEQAERVAQTYQALLAELSMKRLPPKAKIISILRGRKTA